MPLHSTPAPTRPPYHIEPPNVLVDPRTQLPHLRPFQPLLHPPNPLSPHLLQQLDRALRLHLVHSPGLRTRRTCPHPSHSPTCLRPLRPHNTKLPHKDWCHVRGHRLRLPPCQAMVREMSVPCKQLTFQRGLAGGMKM